MVFMLYFIKLKYLLSFPIIGIIFILFINKKQLRLIKLLVLNFNNLSFIAFLLIFIMYNKSFVKFQYLNKISILFFINLNFLTGVDGIAILFILLTILLISLCILISWENIKHSLKDYLILFLTLKFFLINLFCSLNLLFFYIFFEAVLIPMFLIIGLWGSRQRKILANYYFFMYTFLGSIIMLLSIIYINEQIGTTDYQTLLVFKFSFIEQKILWVCFFLSFAAKIPMFPIYLWLPEAHVEAPTTGSVILAGVLLKLGVFGIIRFSLCLFIDASYYFAPLVYLLCILGILLGSFSAIRQMDLKKIIAYTSIAHMNLVVLGLFSFNVNGLEGSIFQSLSHGFTSSGLFLLIGLIYERYKTRIVQYYSGLAIVMPIFSFLFIFFSLSNIAFPGTANFIGEFLIFLGFIKINFILSLISAVSLIISSVYSLWLLNRIIFGNLKLDFIKKFNDLHYRELFIFLPLILCLIFSGIYSSIFLTVIHHNVNYLTELFYI